MTMPHPVICFLLASFGYSMRGLYSIAARCLSFEASVAGSLDARPPHQRENAAMQRTTARWANICMVRTAISFGLIADKQNGRTLSSPAVVKLCDGEPPSQE